MKLSQVLRPITVVGVALLWTALSAAGPAAAQITPETAQHVHGEEHPAHETLWVKVLDVDVSEAFSFRPDRGEVCHLRYRLPDAGRVSIRVKQRGTRELFLATILNWEARPAGEHTETWDGRDYSGNLVDRSQITVSIVAQKPDAEAGTVALTGLSDEEIVHGEKRHQHATHHPWAEEVPVLRVLEPSPQADLSGVVVIHTEVDADRRGYGNQHGYGVRYYLDGVLAREEFYKPESDGRFLFRLDTTAFEDGPHTLRVGMCDHHQHATSASVPVFIRNTEARKTQGERQ